MSYVYKWSINRVTIPNPVYSYATLNRDNIKMDHRERGWIGMDWIDVAQDRDAIVKIRVT
jgi:hypothetical protein